MTKRMPHPSQSAQRSPGSPPAPRSHGLDPLLQPIHRFPLSLSEANAAKENPEPGSIDALADDSYPRNEHDEIEDSAQPHDEDGVTEDMSSLALNPAGEPAGRLKPIDLERLAEAEATSLHLNGDFGPLDDAAIMLELKAGNMAAFDVLLNKYRKPIVNFMYRMTRNQAVAEELAQEVFLRVFRSRETYRAEARFSTWLYRIATNLGVNHARDTRHERAAATIYLDEPDSDTGTTPDVADQTPGVEATLLRDERMAAIRDCVMALPERQRTAVLMHKYEGMDYKQIGDVLKLSESATKSLLFRAYQTLRDKLKGFV
jgi:RNA polymerase sigma-70 factor, ECF subfamily